MGAPTPWFVSCLVVGVPHEPWEEKGRSALLQHGALSGFEARALLRAWGSLLLLSKAGGRFLLPRPVLVLAAFLLARGSLGDLSCSEGHALQTLHMYPHRSKGPRAALSFLPTHPGVFSPGQGQLSLCFWDHRQARFSS